MTGSRPKSEALRVLVFVRHGRYETDPERLTAAGRRQARATARALKSLEVARIHASTMPRARETARIIADVLGKRVRADDRLCEGLLPMEPALARRVLGPHPTAAARAEQAKVMRQTRRRADRAFRSLFTRPTRGRTTEVVVSHGNVIRYWVCRALGIDPNAWTRMDAHNCSLTVIAIHGDGRRRLSRFGDIGHLPPSLRTL